MTHKPEKPKGLILPAQGAAEGTKGRLLPLESAFIPEVQEDMSRVSETEARGMFKHMFEGSREVKETFGILPDAVPAIPFPRAVLERASRAGYSLVLQTRYMNMEGFSSSNAITLAQFKKIESLKLCIQFDMSTSEWASFGPTIDIQEMRLGWKLVHGNPEKCLPQVQSIVHQLDRQVSAFLELYEGVKLPMKIQEEVLAFRSIRPALARNAGEPLIVYESRVIDLLKGLAIFSRLNEQPNEIVYRNLIKRQVGGHSSYELSKSIRTSSFVTITAVSQKQTTLNVTLKSLKFYSQKGRTNNVSFEASGMFESSEAYATLSCMMEPEIGEFVPPEL